MPTNSVNNFAGIEVALDTMRGVVVNENGEIIDRRESSYEPEHLIKAIVELTAGLRQTAELKSVGLAIPGLVNRETDRVLISTGLPFTAQQHIHAELMQATGLRYELENDANAAAYGEYKVGAGRGARDIFYLGIGDAIGGAMILNGKIGRASCRERV